MDEKNYIHCRQKDDFSPTAVNVTRAAGVKKMDKVLASTLVEVQQTGVKQV
jgi:hypothetical protein